MKQRGKISHSTRDSDPHPVLLKNKVNLCGSAPTPIAGEGIKHLVNALPDAGAGLIAEVQGRCRPSKSRRSEETCTGALAVVAVA